MDEKMIPIIKEINDAGVETYASCQGHDDQAPPQVYVLMEYREDLIPLLKFEYFDALISTGNMIDRRAILLTAITTDFEEPRAELLAWAKNLKEELE